MIKHICDGCGKELRVYAVLNLYPKWVRDHVSVSPHRYELCDSCYDKLGNIILDIPSPPKEEYQ